MNQADVLFVFDVGGVLIELDPAARDEALAAGRKANTAALDFSSLPKDLMRGFRLGLVDETTYIETLARHFEVSPDTIIEAENAYIAGVDTEMTGLVQVLKRHFRVVCLSNTQAIHWRRVSHELLGCDLFDANYLSHIMHMEKPDPAIYAAVTRTEAGPLRRVVFIDDTPENIEAAHQHGWTGSILHVSSGDTIAAVADLLGLSAEPDEADLAEADGAFRPNIN